MAEFMLVANYGDRSVLRFDRDGLGEVYLKFDDDSDAPFGANCIVLKDPKTFYLSLFDSDRVLAFPGGEIVLDGDDGVATPDAIAFGPDERVFVANRTTQQIIVYVPGQGIEVFETGVGVPMSMVTVQDGLYIANSLGELFFRSYELEDEARWIGAYGAGGNVAICSGLTEDVVYFLDGGVLQEIDPLTGESIVRATDLGRADEGLAMWEHNGCKSHVLLAADYALDKIWQVRMDTWEVSVFADETMGLNGPSGLAAFKIPRDCGPYTRCDSNCDGVVDFDDIDAFVLAIVCEADYSRKYSSCDWRCNNDLNDDYLVDFNDIDPFVECLMY
jgi:hypothetical protein